jgi:hypothetical protein
MGAGTLALAVLESSSAIGCPGHFVEIALVQQSAPKFTAVTGIHEYYLQVKVIL